MSRSLGSLPVLAVAEAEESAPCGLSAAECRSCAALPEHQRADWRAGRLAARRAAAGALGVAEAECVAAPGRPPRILVGEAGGHRPARVSLSLSHRDGRGAAAADPRGRRVGVDLEREGAVAPGSERYFLSPAEREAAGALDATALWTLKEAAWKALGCDDATPFTALELRFDAEGRLCGLSVGEDSVRARAEISSPWPGYLLSLLWVEEEGR